MGSWKRWSRNVEPLAARFTEETVDIQADCVRKTRFNSRKVSGGGTLLGDLAQLTCRIRLLRG
jgi:hypothetical protein